MSSPPAASSVSRPGQSQMYSTNPTLWKQHINKENTSTRINTHRPTDSFSLGWSASPATSPISPTSPTDRPHKRGILQRSWASMVTSSILPGGSNETWNDNANTHSSASHPKISVAAASYSNLPASTSPPPKHTQPDYYAPVQRKPIVSSDISSYANSFKAAQGFNPYSKNASKQFNPAAGL